MSEEKKEREIIKDEETVENIEETVEEPTEESKEETETETSEKPQDQTEPAKEENPEAKEETVKPEEPAKTETKPKTKKVFTLIMYLIGEVICFIALLIFAIYPNFVACVIAGVGHIFRSTGRKNTRIYFSTLQSFIASLFNVSMFSVFMLHFYSNLYNTNSIFGHDNYFAYLFMLLFVISGQIIGSIIWLIAKPRQKKVKQAIDPNNPYSKYTPTGRLEKQARKEEIKKLKKIHWTGIVFRILTILACGLMLSFIIVQMVARNAIVKDVEEKINFMSTGDMNWVTYSEVEISNELLQYMSGEIVSSEESLENLMVKNNTFNYRIGFVGSKRCLVTIKCDGYGFDNYMDYCLSNNVTTHEEIIRKFSRYVSKNEPDYHNEITLLYYKENGKWHCNYNDPEFLDVASCGMVSAYSEYYENSLNNIQELINNITSEEETDNE